MNEETLSAFALDAKLPVAKQQWTCSYQDLYNSTCALAANYTATGSCHEWVYKRDYHVKTSIATEVRIYILIATNLKVLTSFEQFNLVCSDASKVTLANMLTMVGLLAGSFFLGPVVDMSVLFQIFILLLN